MTRKTLRAVLAALALLVPLGLATPAHASLAASDRWCFRAHVAGIGWQPWQCANGSFGSATQLTLGTTGQGRGIEAVEATASGFDICLQAHVRNRGWLGQSCTKSRVSSASAFAGTTGQALPIEALTISLRTDELVATGPARQNVSAMGHVQNLGWVGPPSGYAKSVTVGTTGRALQLEALQLWFA
jgi:uncharacterized protein YjdB